MAELLVKLVDAQSSDAAKDVSGSYKRGDVVVISEDGHKWGAGQVYPAFAVMKFPGVPVEKFAPLMVPEIQMIKSPLDGKLYPQVVRRRATALDVQFIIQQKGEPVSPIEVTQDAKAVDAIVITKPTVQTT